MPPSSLQPAAATRTHSNKVRGRARQSIASSVLTRCANNGKRDKKRLRLERGAGSPAGAPDPPSPRLRRATFARRGAKVGRAAAAERRPRAKRERGGTPRAV